MRKSILILVFVVSVLLMFNTSCDKVGVEIVLDILEGSGSYSQQDDTSTIRLIGWASFSQSRISKETVWASISYWQFQIKVGNQTMLIIDGTNYPLVVGDIFINVSGLESSRLWVYIEPPSPIPGDIFNGYNPDTIDMIMQVVDENGNSYDVTGTADFEFTRS